MSELRKYYDIEYDATARGYSTQRVYLDEIDCDDFSEDALELAKDYVINNPDVEGDLFGEWEMADDCINIMEYEEGDNSWKCCLCDAEFIGGYGNNPDPVDKHWNARCCDVCNTNTVIPARFKQAVEINKRG